MARWPKTIRGKLFPLSIVMPRPFCSRVRSTGLSLRFS